APVPAALRSVDLRTGEADAAHVERSDTCAVPAAAVVGEAVVALAVAEELFAKLGGDSLAELQAALRLAWRRARLLEGHVYFCGLPGSGKSTVGALAARARTREPLYARISDAQIDVEGLSPEQVARACAAAVRSLEAERAWS